MPRLPILQVKEILKILATFGYVPVRQKGSHIRLSAQGRKSVTVPNHKTIDRSLLLKILRDAEIPVEDFISRI